MEWLQSLGLLGLFLGSFLAATIVPFSSDILFVGILAATKQTVACLAAATAGSFAGSVVTYEVGRLGKWEWIEKWLGISPEKLDKQRVYISKYGLWLALVAWLPFIGDVMVLGLGFYRTRRLLTYILLLVGKFLRYLFWTIVLTV